MKGRSITNSPRLGLLVAATLTVSCRLVQALEEANRCIAIRPEWQKVRDALPNSPLLQATTLPESVAGCDTAMIQLEGCQKSILIGGYTRQEKMSPNYSPEQVVIRVSHTGITYPSLELVSEAQLITLQKAVLHPLLI